MATFVLVHGAWHGSWCWDKVVSLLQQAGHNALTLDLPGRAGDKTSIQDLTLEAYAKKVCNVVNLQDELVILVGHSMGGMMIIQAAEYCPDKIKTLVYLCAFLPQNGQSLLDIAQTDTQGLVLPNLVPNQPEGYLFFKENTPFKDIFYNDCSDADVKRAMAMLVPEPIAPAATPVNTTAANFGRVPRVYVECLQDKAIPAYLQKKMYTALPCRRVISMDTSHSPFFSAPEALVAHLTAL